VQLRVNDSTTDREAIRYETDGTYALTSIGGAAIISAVTCAVQPAAAANKGLIVKGFTSQSATLIEVQNSSAGVLASIDFDGNEKLAGSRHETAATTAISANTNDLALGVAGFQRMNCTSACTLTGIAKPSTQSGHVEGRMIRLYNVGTASLTLAHASTSSTSGNRFYNVTGANLILAPNDYAELIYDTSASAASAGTAGWRVA
jgi:hypothetical protein